MTANELADGLDEDGYHHCADMLRQQQAEIEALKNANRFIQNFAEEQHQRAVALEMRELTNAEILWLADEYSDEENLVADCVGFARAVLRKAQKNG